MLLPVQISTAGTMMAFTGAGISTSCGIPDFRWGRGQQQVLQGLRDREVVGVSRLRQAPTQTDRQGAAQQLPLSIPAPGTGSEPPC
jgi:NAD-dependent SIR2 family protein deacetylase